jgi:hypothetical protein
MSIGQRLWMGKAMTRGEEEGDHWAPTGKIQDLPSR